MMARSAKPPISVTPRTAAMAYRIWAWANERGWDCTVGEIAEALDVSISRVTRVCQLMNWNRRLRSVSATGFQGYDLTYDAMQALHDITGVRDRETSHGADR